MQTHGHGRAGIDEEVLIQIVTANMNVHLDHHIELLVPP